MLHLQQLIDDPALLHEWRPTDKRILVAAPDAQARETYRRTTFPFRWSTEKVGMNPDSWKPLEHQRRLFFKCGKGGCNHLVCVARAYRDARKDSRKTLKPGDGCPNGKCHNRKTWGIATVSQLTSARESRRSTQDRIFSFVGLAVLVRR